MNYEEFYAESVDEISMDLLLAKGFRHFGIHFYRYMFGFYEEGVVQVLPLRIDTAKFKLSHSQKKISKKNSDLQYVFRETVITEEKERLFTIHAERFKRDKPSSLYTFLSDSPSNKPCTSIECSVYLEDKLLAVSFLDIAKNSTSSIYAMFDPEFSKRSLGIYTMLLEIDFTKASGKRFYYPGYAYHEPSFYDYKKNFFGMEYLDWEEEKWLPFTKNST
ncbi:MAG: hypothetical protein SFU98_03630 [Leptospiraceae bacterium]|nr:hypothetical protein [Leptospiraceae bacterium]